jgi:ketosteroid isomerase-like protein
MIWLCDLSVHLSGEYLLRVDVGGRLCARGTEYNLRSLKSLATKDGAMKRVCAIAVLAISAALMPAVVAADDQAPPEAVQKQLIALDKQWGEATDTALLNKILADHMLALGPNGEAQGKQEQVAASAAAAGGAPAGSYLADEHKFDMLSPDIVVMTHRGTTTTTADGKPVNESHRSLHVFQRKNGNWQIVASAQVPIPQK